MTRDEYYALICDAADQLGTGFESDLLAAPPSGFGGGNGGGGECAKKNSAAVTAALFGTQA